MRICIATSSNKDFLSNIHSLISRMKKQGADTNNVIESQSKMTFCHTENFLKFNVKQEDIVKRITS